MGHYWAKFESYEGNLYRFDTRIYIDDIDEVLENDECLGAIVGKNPGSARPKNEILNNFGEIDLKRDKLLPTVRNIVKSSNSQLGGKQYIQVLNLFYLCNHNLDEAIRSYDNSNNPKVCHSENNTFPWVWFMWGGYYNKSLSEKKARFMGIKSIKKFHLNNSTKSVIETFPKDKICAKHTQGMSHNLIVPYLKELLK